MHIVGQILPIAVSSGTDRGPYVTGGPHVVVSKGVTCPLVVDDAAFWFYCRSGDGTKFSLPLPSVVNGYKSEGTEDCSYDSDGTLKCFLGYRDNRYPIGGLDHLGTCFVWTYLRPYKGKLEAEFECGIVNGALDLGVPQIAVGNPPKDTQLTNLSKGMGCPTIYDSDSRTFRFNCDFGLNYPFGVNSYQPFGSFCSFSDGKSWSCRIAIKFGKKPLSLPNWCTVWTGFDPTDLTGAFWALAECKGYGEYYFQLGVPIYASVT